MEVNMEPEDKYLIKENCIFTLLFNPDVRGYFYLGHITRSINEVLIDETSRELKSRIFVTKEEAIEARNNGDLELF